MKADISFSDELIKAIAQEVADRVVASLKPILLAKDGKEAAGVLMGVDELADYLGGVSRDWIYQRTANNEIPFRKVGHLIRFLRSDIDYWLEAQAIPAVAPLSRPLPDSRPASRKKPSQDIKSRGGRNKKCSETAD